MKYNEQWPGKAIKSKIMQRKQDNQKTGEGMRTKTERQKKMGKKPSTVQLCGTDWD